MKLEKWALIAEIVGAMAIVVTLIVLIVEIRGNTVEMRAASLSDLAARTQELTLLPPRNPQYAALWPRFDEGEPLSSGELLQIRTAMVAVLKLGEESFIANRDERLDSDVWRTRAAFVLNSLGTERRRDLYQEIRDSQVLIQAYTIWLDQAIAERYG